jgi:hypothetical protein
MPHTGSLPVLIVDDPPFHRHAGQGTRTKSRPAPSKERWRRAVQTMPLRMGQFGFRCTTAFSDSAAKFWSTTSACRRCPNAPANAQERLRTYILIKWPDSLDPTLRSQARAQLRQSSPADFGSCFHRLGYQILRANRSRLNHPALGLSVAFRLKPVSGQIGEQLIVHYFPPVWRDVDTVPIS